MGHDGIRVRAYCPKCKAPTEVAAQQQGAPWSCACGEQRQTAGTGGYSHWELRRCVFCGCDKLYIEKDFHQGLGCAIMLAPIGIAFLLPWELGISLPVSLLSLWLVDMLLYYFVVPFRVVCYRCCAEHRGADRSSDHQPYDITTAELFQSTEPGTGAAPPQNKP